MRINEVYDELERVELSVKVRNIIDNALKSLNKDWIPVSSGLLPNPNEVVLVTYIGIYDNEPYCDELAYIDEKGKWNWSEDGSPTTVPITAWRYTGSPYFE